RARRYWSAKVWLAARQAARVMTVSSHAAAGIAGELGIIPSRINVVGEAPAAVFAPDADLLAGQRALEAAAIPPDTRFFLYVGGIAPHKNLGALVDAVQTLPPDVRLVIVGDFAHDAFLSAYPALRRRAETGGGDRVAFTGRLDDRPVAALMRL